MSDNIENLRSAARAAAARAKDNHLAAQKARAEASKAADTAQEGGARQAARADLSKWVKIITRATGRDEVRVTVRRRWGWLAFFVLLALFLFVFLSFSPRPVFQAFFIRLEEVPFFGKAPFLGFVLFLIILVFSFLFYAKGWGVSSYAFNSTYRKIYCDELQRQLGHPFSVDEVYRDSPGIQGERVRTFVGVQVSWSQ